jgi:hypothetical protein
LKKSTFHLIVFFSRQIEIASSLLFQIYLFDLLNPTQPIVNSFEFQSFLQHQSPCQSEGQHQDWPDPEWVWVLR